MKVTVIGAGAWGSALAKVLHENGNAVTVWDIDQDLLEELRQGRSERYLPGVPLPSALKATSDLPETLAAAELVLFEFCVCRDCPDVVRIVQSHHRFEQFRRR